MASFWNKVGNWWGDVSGKTQQKAGQKQMATAAKQAAQAGQQAGAIAGQTGQALNTSMGGSAAEMMQRANAAATDQAAQGANLAATQAGRANVQAARTAGVNKGQAAMLAGQNAGDVYSGALQGGLESGRAQYGQNVGQFAGREAGAADRQLAATGQQAQIGQAGQQAGQAKNQQLWGTIGNIAGAGAKLLSDEDAKNIKGKPDIGAILAKIDPVRFAYKDDPTQTEQVGVTAQNVEETPLAGAVVDTPEGKQLDTKQLTGANLALMSELYKRIEALEARK